MKACSYCKQSKPTTEYNRNKTKPDGYQSHCRQCQSMHHRKNSYNLTPQQLQQLLDNQDGQCPLCQQPLTLEEVDVDHDHTCCPGRKSCGQCIRSLLHGQCNRSLGVHDSEWHRRAADLIDRHRQAQATGPTDQDDWAHRRDTDDDYLHHL